VAEAFVWRRVLVRRVSLVVQVVPRKVVKANLVDSKPNQSP